LPVELEHLVTHVFFILGRYKVNVFERMESEVRSYCRAYPAVFKKALGDKIYDVHGNEYLDFLSGAGALNYGHNNELIKSEILRYIESDGITHSLDLHTVPKAEFLEKFSTLILEPRGLEYKVQFPGPTGTNAVEAALKIARLYTGRSDIVAFTNAYHGMTLGALAVTGNKDKRAGASFNHVTRIPYDGYMESGLNGIDYLEKLILDKSSGVELPAAIIVETVQAEGGLNVASIQWLRRLSEFSTTYDIPLIVDDIQSGCGRTGSFFSFERAGIKPDIVCLSKSISGYGVPMSLTLITPKMDVWKPGQHNGTFRGNNLAFVAASAALEFWRDTELERSINEKSKYLNERLEQIVKIITLSPAKIKGLGMLRGIEWADPLIAGYVSKAAYELGLIIETCGPMDNVLKAMPPLVICMESLKEGLDIIEQAVVEVEQGFSSVTEIA
jgi:diaminobutyrate-2-oxoglutarate transaminase